MNGTHHRLLLLRKVCSRVFTNINTTTTDGLVSNRLYHVDDVVSAGNYTDDIDDQGTFNNTHSTIETANNYGYDELGNLVRDAQEEIASIEWTVYGKMKKITRNSGSSKADLEFGYDASGNRLWKKVTPKGSGAVTSTYYYLRDAQGNEMCRYVKYTNTTNQLMYVAQEHSIYGSSRVGVDNRKDTLYLGAAYTPTWGEVGTSRRDLGSKSFELANHLGNVLVTVSDKPVYKVSSGTIYFNPEVSSISDYYPFGAPINGRSFSSTEYRCGFNGKENDDETQTQDYGFRVFDPRLGRFLSVDPLIADYPYYSSFQFSGNSPILSIDLDGLEPEKDLNNIQQANKKIDDFAENSSAGIYLNVNKLQFLSGLRSLINDKNGYGIAQACNRDGSYLCQTAALLNDYEHQNSVEVAEFAISLYTTGCGTLNGKSFTINGDQHEYVGSEKAKANNSSNNPVDLMLMLAVRFNGGNFKSGDEMSYGFGLVEKGGTSFNQATQMYKTLFGDLIQSHGSAININGELDDQEVKDLSIGLESGNFKLTALISHKFDLNKKMIGKGGIGTHFINIHGIKFEGKRNVLIEYSDYGTQDEPRSVNITVGMFKRSVKGVITIDNEK